MNQVKQLLPLISKKFNESHWFRLSVCLLPGLVLGKIEGMIGPSATMSGASSYVFIGGLAVYLLWARIQKTLGIGPDAEAPEAGSDEDQSNPTLPAADELALLVELLKSHEGATDLAMRMIATEIALDQSLTLGGAIERATHRRRLELNIAG